LSSELRDRLQQALGSAVIIDRELGGGGMSRVFVGRETALGPFLTMPIELLRLRRNSYLISLQRSVRLAKALCAISSGSNLADQDKPRIVLTGELP
jgi:hypothetical protein